MRTGRRGGVDRGNTIITVSGEDLEAWKAAAEPVYEEWVADMDSKGYDGQALIDEARTLIEKYTPQYQ